VNIFLWVLQVLLALAFLGAGVTKVSQPKAKLRDRMAWVDSFNEPTVKFIGAVEILGALGLILPAATGIAPVLTPLAATGLAIVMVLAAITHVRRNEARMIPVNAVLFLVAAVIAWGRFGPYHF
jgi:uncharacterized membrane protein YphA (DoxX/SURF4 family)